MMLEWAEPTGRAGLSRLVRAMTALTLAALLALSWTSAATAQAQSTDAKVCDEGKGDAAIAACTRIIQRGKKETDRRRAVAYYNRGIANQDKADLSRAINDYSETIRLEPKHIDAYIYRGDAHFQAGDLERAIADYSEAIAIYPERATAYARRGLVYSEKRDLDQAIADYNAAVRKDPKDAEIYYNRGSAHYENGDLNWATLDYNQAIHIDPNVPQYYLNRALVYRARGDLDRAISDSADAIRINPKYWQAYLNRAESHRAKGDLVAAMNDFEACLQINPNLRAATEGLAAIKLEVARATSPFPVPASVTSAAPAVARPASARETRVALVIGNSAYSSVPRLENPKRDAKAVAAALRASGFTKVIEAADLTREQLLTAVRAFAAEADKADWAMVYFAGHGLEIGGMNYLIPVDAKLLSDRDVQFEALPLNTLLSALEGARKLRLVVLDACRNNPFASQMKMASAGRSVGRGLGRIEPDAGTLVVYAARDGQIAQDGDGANSPFATALTKHMATPGIEIDKMFRRVSDDVMAATNRKQEPYTYGRLSGQEDYVFTAPK